MHIRINKKRCTNPGFTLIEMLVIIAIIAILVALTIPIVSSATKKANAAADAANLRNVLGEANVLISDNEPNATVLGTMSPVVCKSIPSAIPYIAYKPPGFIDVYYVIGTNYYGLDYFSEVAETGISTKVLTSQPSGYTWYPVGTGGGSGE